MWQALQRNSVVFSKLGSRSASNVVGLKPPLHVLTPIIIEDWVKSKPGYDQLVWRTPRADDFAAVARHCDGFQGTDYLPAYWNYFINAKNRRNIILTTKSGEFLNFSSVLLLDNGEIAYWGTGRTAIDRRGHGYQPFSSSRVLLRAFAEFADRMNDCVWIYRFDERVLPPRFWPWTSSEHCTNRIINCNYMLQLSTTVGELDKVCANLTRLIAGKVEGKVKSDITEIRFEDTYAAVKSVCETESSDPLVPEFFAADSTTYRFSEANFSAENGYNKRVFVSRPSGLAHADGVSFVSSNVCPIGLHFKQYHYSSKQNILYEHILRALVDSASSVRQLGESDMATLFRNGLAPTVRFEPDRVHLTLVFSIKGHSPQALRALLYEAGLRPGVSGGELERHYVGRDEALCYYLRTRHPLFLAAVERERELMLGEAEAK